jgi:TetR/AcrR family transcriptional repressor of mexJK operon
MPPRRTHPQAGPGRPKDPDKHQAILAAASRLFAEQRFDDVSMSAIALAAGVSKLTLYSHFGDKRTLFAESVRRHCALLLADALDELPEHGDAATRLQALGETLLDALLSPPALCMQRRLIADDCSEPALRALLWQSGPGCMLATVAGRLQHLAVLGVLPIAREPAAIEAAAEQFIQLVRGDWPLKLIAGLVDLPAAPARRAHVARAVRCWLGGHGLLPATPVTPPA